ncbi:MAG: hypothetical protein V1789_08440, partial [PVC group bacterium]
MERRERIKQNTGGRGHPAAGIRIVLQALFSLFFFWSGAAAVYGADGGEIAELSREGYSRANIGDRAVFWKMRMIGDALVERDFTVVQFDAANRRQLSKKECRRPGLPDQLPPVISKEDAEFLAGAGGGEEVLFSRLIFISPESAVFPLHPPPENPCWVVRVLTNGSPAVVIIDAVTGDFLGYGVPPPYDAFSLTGPQNSGPCSGSWTLWYKNAETWFNTMGYPCEAIEWPAEAEVQGHIGSYTTGMFYELAHGGSTYFKSGCTGGTTYEYTRASEVETWIADYPKMPFAFIGSCDGLCSTGDGSLSYEFRKGESVETATVGYCGMSGSDCSLCWIYSLLWQNALFDYMNDGYTVKAAFDRALADYPMCAPPYDCMRFAGDESFAGPYVRPGPSPTPSSSSAPAPATPALTPSAAPSPVPTATVWTPSAWPAGPGTEIGGSLPAGYEPSGAVWHERLGVLFLVSDDGWVSRINQDGTGPVTWVPGSDDLEGITVADGDSDYLYVGVEDPDSIREFDITTGAYTGKSWNLTAWMTGAAGQGLEALTFVPDGDHPYSATGSGGLFYAGLQADGRIYVFDVDLAHSGTVSPVDTIEPYPGLTDLSGLHYHTETGVLYAVFDTWNLLLEMETDGTVIEAFLLPGDTQEGVTMMPSCPASVTSIFIAEDAGEVWRYDGYPVTCPAAPTPTTAPTSTAPPPTQPPTPVPSASPTPSEPPPPPSATPTPTPAPSSTPTPTPVPAPTSVYLVVGWDDYNGDGYTDYALFNGGTWDFMDAQSGTVITEGVVWGDGEGDFPAPGDYNGDGTADLAYYNRFSARWYVKDTLTGEVITSGLEWGLYDD